MVFTAKQDCSGYVISMKVFVAAYFSCSGRTVNFLILWDLGNRGYALQSDISVIDVSSVLIGSFWLSEFQKTCLFMIFWTSFKKAIAIWQLLWNKEHRPNSQTGTNRVVSSCLKSLACLINYWYEIYHNNYFWFLLPWNPNRGLEVGHCCRKACRKKCEGQQTYAKMEKFPCKFTGIKQGHSEKQEMGKRFCWCFTNQRQASTKAEWGWRSYRNNNHGRCDWGALTGTDLFKPIQIVYTSPTGSNHFIMYAGGNLRWDRLPWGSKLMCWH